MGNNKNSMSRYYHESNCHDNRYYHDIIILATDSNMQSTGIKILKIGFKSEWLKSCGIYDNIEFCVAQYYNKNFSSISITMTL